jgi:hypothetical protein
VRKERRRREENFFLELWTRRYVRHLPHGCDPVVFYGENGVSCYAMARFFRAMNVQFELGPCVDQISSSHKRRRETSSMCARIIS